MTSTWEYVFGKTKRNPFGPRTLPDGTTYTPNEELPGHKGIIAGSIFEPVPGGRHVILGAGSVLCKEFRKAMALKNPEEKFRFVTDKVLPKMMFESDETYKVADYLNKENMEYLLRDAKIVYIMHEFEYSLSVWKDKWPKFMRLVLDICIKNKSKLVFLDNDYIYSEDEVGNMTEESKQNPSSKKGQVRLEICNMMFNEIKAGKLTGMIVRSAELYGVWIKEKSSKLMVMVYKRLKVRICR
jgi:hypothetical protein